MAIRGCDDERMVTSGAARAGRALKAIATTTAAFILIPTAECYALTFALLSPLAGGGQADAALRRYKEVMLVVGAILFAVGLVMLLKRDRLIDVHFFAQRPFSDADQSTSIAKFNVVGGALVLLLIGGVLVLVGIGAL